MKKFKKVLLVTLAAITVMSFAACSKSDSDDNDDKSTKETTTKEINTEDATKEKSTKEPATKEINTEDATKEKSTKENNGDINSKSYEGKGYTMSLPENWYKTKNDDADIFFVDQKSPNRSTPSSINVVIEDCSAFEQIQTSEDYMKAALMQFDANKMFSVIDSDTDTCNGYDVGVVNISASNGTYEYKCLQYYFMQDQVAYVVTFTGDLNGGFDSTVDRAKEIFGTFKFTK